MEKSFNCLVCGKLIDRSSFHPACKKTCGSVECQAVYSRESIRKFDQNRQRQRIKELEREGVDLVTCGICNQKFEMIGLNHLKTHGLTVQQYVERYPNLPRLNSRMKAKRGKQSKNNSQYLKYQGKTINKQFYEFITGSLLGDGSLEKRSDKRNARYAEGGNNQQYLEWKYNFLKQYIPCSWRERLSAPHTKTGKQYQGWWLRTTVHPDLTDLQKQWYNPKKIVPQDIIQKYLTEFALTVWFCDDGCVSNGIFIYTMSFSDQEVAFLVNLLNDRFSLSAKILKNKNNQPMIRFNAESKDRFRQITSKFKIPGMEYKLDF
ncbi:MAG: hypothetical protein ABEI32_13980 [Halothece sp.]